MVIQTLQFAALFAASDAKRLFLRMRGGGLRIVKDTFIANLYEIPGRVTGQ